MYRRSNAHSSRFKLITKFVAAFSATAVLFAAPITHALGSYTWTPATVPAITGFCYNVASSSTGQYLSCADYDGDLVVSNDYGQTWTDLTNPGSKDWIGISISATGQYMAASVEGGDIWKSVDYGQTWTDVVAAGTEDWGNVAISDDGQHIAATDSANNVIAVSNNGGTTWATTAPVGASSLFALAMSGSGQYLVTGDVSGGNYYTSNDYGQTWTTVSNSGNWYGATVSRSGQYQIVTNDGSGTFELSSNYGQTWVPVTVPGTSSFYAAAISTNGQDIIVGDSFGPGDIHESYDGGQTWYDDSAAGSVGWYLLAASDDLSRVFTVENSGQLILGDNSTLYVAPPANNTSGGTSNTTATVPELTDTGIQVTGVTGMAVVILSVSIYVRYRRSIHPLADIGHHGKHSV